MRERIDYNSTVPLYHQIAEAVRYAIATGELGSGKSLPSLRRGAELWAVNLQTVRRAYNELEKRGLVRVRNRAQAIVLPSDGAAITSPGGDAARDAVDLEAFASAVAQEARHRWGATPEKLAAAVAAAARGVSEVVHVVECSATQAEDLARDLEERWAVRAVGWSLKSDAAPPEGLVVATYFHYNDVRARWPSRLPEVRFVAIRPDAALRDRVLAVTSDAQPVEVVLVEREPAMVRNIAADLSRILPAPAFNVRPLVIEGDGLPAPGGPPVLCAPRVWGALPASARRRTDVLEVRYRFEPTDLSRLGYLLRWKPR